MDLLIDARGRRQQKCAVRLPCAIWRKGFIHIRENKQGIVVSLSPALVKGPAVAGAVYAIADIKPKYTSLIIERSNYAAIVFDANWKAACRWICEVVAADRHTEQAQAALSRQDAEPAREPETPGDPEYIIATTLNQYARCSPEFLSRTILEQLWEAGYDVRPKRC